LRGRHLRGGRKGRCLAGKLGLSQRTGKDAGLFPSQGLGAARGLKAPNVFAVVINHPVKFAG
jgi:hypothetical protein